MLSTGRLPGLVLAAATALMGATATSAAAATPAYAPLDQKGPALSVPADKLAASLACKGPAGSGRQPILLVPGTTMDPKVGFSWNYARAFDRKGWRYCLLTLPQDATGDIQRSGQYVVNAVRTMHLQSGKQVDVLGWSQGGMVPRWALRFWPDTRTLVDDVIGLSPSNHGTIDADASCGASA